MGGKTSAKSKNEWISKAYDRINLTVPKGRKEEIEKVARRNGESVNGFINRLINTELAQAGAGFFSSVEPGEGTPAQGDGFGFRAGGRDE